MDRETHMQGTGAYRWLESGAGMQHGAAETRVEREPGAEIESAGSERSGQKTQLLPPLPQLQTGPRAESRVDGYSVVTHWLCYPRNLHGQRGQRCCCQQTERCHLCGTSPNRGIVGTRAVDMQLKRASFSKHIQASR